MFDTVLWFLDRVWLAIWLALQFSPDLLQRVEANPWSGAVIGTVAVLGGVSLLLGQSVVLFVNRVSPRRFVWALLIGGLQYALGLALWGAIIWLVGLGLFSSSPSLRSTIRLVGLASAPYVFGVFVLIPYFGTLLGRLLTAWGLLIAINAVAFTFGVGYGAALLCVGLGWSAWVLLETTIGRPVVRVYRWFWRRAVGPYHNVSPQEVYALAMRDAGRDETGQR